MPKEAWENVHTTIDHAYAGGLDRRCNVLAVDHWDVMLADGNPDTFIDNRTAVGTLDGLAFEVNKTQSVMHGPFSTLSFNDFFAYAPVFLADFQSSDGGSPINVRWEHKDLGGIDVKIDSEPDVTGDGSEPQNTDVVGHILSRSRAELASIGSDHTCAGRRLRPGVSVDAA